MAKKKRKYGKRIRKATKAKITLNKTEKGLFEESRRLGSVNQKVNRFHYQITGPIKDSTIEEYKDYVKALKPGLEQINIYEWENQKAAYIDKAKTWKGRDRWLKGKKLNIGREIAIYQNNQFITDAQQRNFYNSYKLGGGDKPFEVWKAEGGVQEIQTLIDAKRQELIKKGHSSKEISVIIGQLFFGSE